MALIFKPGLWKNGSIFWLPAPVTSFPSLHEFKSKLEEPIKSIGGRTRHNRKYKSSVITITGLMARDTYWDRDFYEDDPTTPFLTDVEMIGTYASLVDFLKMPLDTDEMRLIGWYDAESEATIEFRGIFPISISTDAGDPHRNMMPYTIQLDRLDPAIYQ